MQSGTRDTFENRNTHFVLQFISPQQSKNTLPHHLGDISTSTLFEDSRDYSCIPNLKNTAVYLSETTYSGKLLNTHHKLRDETSNKFLFASSTEKYNIDAIYSDKYKYTSFLFVQLKYLVLVQKISMQKTPNHLFHLL